ncbi:DNA replication/repair protein RecF [Schumannella luteola]|uniref:DNA replication and repair protein RecF n=1 Tax=Schumannella luteola TaxID=472059 RepID=A0A852YA16_9MICO|nr:DNA replication and repair protein RecF [Schumannella luteola]TPX01780.1 DNA replication/repair protein RecF [Schumannella luteola]
MIVSHLQLTDFRNYAEAEVQLHPGPNLLVGRNGQGKTNLVEAIGYLATLGSHRVSTDAALVRSGRESAIVRTRLQHGDRSLLVELQINKAGANRAQVNRAPAKTRDLPRHVATVLFAPEDLALVRGEPSGRRRMLDQLLIQLTPRLAGVVGDYERVLRQRNTLLKTARAAARGGDLSTLDVWDERLVTFGAELIVARLELVERLRPFVADAYKAIAGDEHRADLGMRMSVFGASPDEDDPTSAADSEHRRVTIEVAAEAFRESLARLRRQEIDRGVTLAGPHRDDLVLELNGLPARGYASHGESWSFALSLKLAAAGILRVESPTGDPVVILDDVFAELDETRRARLASAIGDFEQVIITAAVEGDVPVELAQNVLRIRAGEVVDE